MKILPQHRKELDVASLNGENARYLALFAGRAPNDETDNEMVWRYIREVRRQGGDNFYLPDQVIFDDVGRFDGFDMYE